MIATLGHEYQHLINASRRMYVNTAATDFEETWLDEGLSHVAEELLFYARTGLKPRANIDATLLRTSSAYVDAFNNEAISNFSRLGEYLACAVFELAVRRQRRSRDARRDLVVPPLRGGSHGQRRRHDLVPARQLDVDGRREPHAGVRVGPNDAGTRLGDVRASPTTSRPPRRATSSRRGTCARSSARCRATARTRSPPRRSPAPRPPSRSVAGARPTCASPSLPGRPRPSSGARCRRPCSSRSFARGNRRNSKSQQSHPWQPIPSCALSHLSAPSLARPLVRHAVRSSRTSSGSSSSRR